MQITPIKHGLELGLSAPGYVRSPGPHASDLYGALFEALEPKRFDKSRPMDVHKLELGMAFEEALEEALKARLIGTRPGEFTSEEGVIFSPDLLLFEKGRTRVGEIKLTWMSSRGLAEADLGGFPPKFDKWLCQIKLYARWLDTCYARLYALFVNGDYDRSRGMSPELLAWDLEFTTRELEENYQMVMNHARHVGLLK